MVALKKPFFAINYPKNDCEIALFAVESFNDWTEKTIFWID